MPKLHSYHSVPQGRSPRRTILFLSLLLSFFFTGPLLYLLGITCRPSPAAVSAAIRVLESRKAGVDFPANESPIPASPSSSPPPAPKRPLHKYDLLNDLHEGDDPGSASFLDLDNDVLLNGSLSNANATLRVDERTMVHAVTLGHRADWLTVHAYHRFCDTMLTNPVPAPVPLCIRGPSMECVDGPQRNLTPFFARHGQDFYLHMAHFGMLNRTGVYLDIGTRHPVMGSPTYFFDACMRWKGVCVEAAADVYQYIHRQRSCDLAPTCLTQHDNEKVDFVTKPPHGGVKGHDLLHPSLRNKTARDGVMKTRLICTNVATLVKRSNVRLIDLVTLSVDGQELDVLKGFGFESLMVNVILVTVSNYTLAPIQNFLATQGFVRHLPVFDNVTTTESGLLHDDAIFVYRDVVWGHPV